MQIDKKTRQKIFIAGIIASIPIIYTSIFFFNGSLKGIDRKTQDFFFNHFNSEKKISDKIVIVDIDETSLNAYSNEPSFGRWPWKRNVYFPVLEYISAGSPKIILFDIFFVGKTAEDKFLALANSAIPSLSHAITFQNEIGESMGDLKDFEKSHSFLPIIEDGSKILSYNRMSFPAGSIGETTKSVHSVTIHSDEDGVARQFALFAKAGSDYFPTLALKAFGEMNPFDKLILKNSFYSIQKKDGTFLEIPSNDKGFVRAYQYSKKQIESVPRYSISGVLESKRKIDSGEITNLSELLINPEVFKDKIVIIGTSAAATHDEVVLPIGKYPGVMFQLVQVSNMLLGHFILEIPDWINFVFSFLLIAVTAFILFYIHNNSLKIFSPIGLFLIFPVVSVTLFQFEIYFPISSVLISFPIFFIGMMGYLTFVEGAEKRKYSKILGNMVDPSVVQEALLDLDALKKGGEKEITAFFSDVAGFSTISEKLNSTDLASLLNEYLSAMTIILKHRKGTLDKYIGDAIVGIFGAPVESKYSALESALASLEMIEQLEELKKYWTSKNLYSKDASEMKIRIGLNSGLAKVGFMGTDSLASYTMMGDTVNLAARLEAAGKDYGVNILISHSTKEKIDNEIFTRRLDLIRVKGKNEPVQVYELIGKKNTILENILHSVDLYEKGFQNYINRDWQSAILNFQNSAKIKGTNDKSCKMLIDRCTEFLKSPPPENWDGVFTRTHK